MKTKKQFTQTTAAKSTAYIKKSKNRLALLLMVFGFIVSTHITSAQTIGDPAADYHSYPMLWGGGPSGQGEFIQNYRQNSGGAWGIDFFTSYTRRMLITASSIGMYLPLYVSDNLTVSGQATFNGTVSNFAMVNDGDITNLDVIQGYNDLRFQATSTSGTNLYINESGNVGIGTTDPETKLHVTGVDNNGTTAALAVGSPGQLMLLDGNEIDAKEGDLYVNNNSSHNVLMAMGGGNVGIGTESPETRLHVTSGNIRVDSGEYQSWGPIILHPDTDQSGDDNILFMNGAGEEVMRINDDSNVGIGTASPSEKLEVVGTIKATSFVSSAASFPDYVFAEDYKITPLSELENYVKANKHLPNMPSEKEVVKKGLNVPEVLTRSVENIETIYLHLIRMEKKIEALKQENAVLKQQLQKCR